MTWDCACNQLCYGEGTDCGCDGSCYFTYACDCECYSEACGSCYVTNYDPCECYGPCFSYSYTPCSCNMIRYSADAGCLVV